MRSRSFISRSKTALSNPRLVCRELNALSHRLVPRWNFAKRGCDFMMEDWDNLLILDACRYDLFEAENWIPGELEHRYSTASSTVDFLATNIDGKDLSDTVYVTANGQIQNYADELDTNFYDVVPLYAEAWDDSLGTVPPGPVTEAVESATKRFPNKRLLVHYVQPHFPFIGAETDADKQRSSEATYDRAFWRRAFDGDIAMTREQLWNAYADTFRLVLPHVEDAVDALTGKTVITSDHGNMFGERGHPIPIREWGHPGRVYYPDLITVPWLECEWDTRKRIVAEQPRDTTLQADPAAVQDRLEHLGYK